MSAAVTTQARPLRALRATGPLLTEVARRWPALIEAAASVTDVFMSPDALVAWRDLARADRFGAARSLACIALGNTYERCERFPSPELATWVTSRFVRPEAVPAATFIGTAVVMLCGAIVYNRGELPDDFERLLDAELRRCAS